MSELLIKNKITEEWEAIPYIAGSQGPEGEDGEPGKNGSDDITPHYITYTLQKKKVK